MEDRFGNSYETPVLYDNCGDNHRDLHFCGNIADVFRYCDGFDDNTNICLVEGSGEIYKYDDEIFEYFDMYVPSKLRVISVLSREEILAAALEGSFPSVLRFISGYKLTEEEIAIILDKYKDKHIENYINYYQRNDEKAFQRKIK